MSAVDVLIRVLFGLVNLVLVVTLLALVVRRVAARAPRMPRSALFGRLAEAHGLSEAQRSALQGMAARQGVPDPAVYFVSPSALAEGLSRLRREAPALARAAEGLPERLFGGGRRG